MISEHNHDTTTNNNFTLAQSNKRAHTRHCFFKATLAMYQLDIIFYLASIPAG